jgi:pimeloyl-ACP methyl ester carboxylesterase
MATTTASPFLSDAVESQHVDGPAARYAYRRFGKPDAVPVVFCTRFRATFDHWDPALLDVLAAEREVIVFDNVGTASSTGTTPARRDWRRSGASTTASIAHTPKSLWSR